MMISALIAVATTALAKAHDEGLLVKRETNMANQRIMKSSDGGLGIAESKSGKGAKDECKSIETTFEENQSSGNMFTINALQNITVNRFAIHTLYIGQGNAQVWGKPGSYTDSEVESDWMVIQNVDVKGKGSSEQTVLQKLVNTLMIQEYTEYSFYIVTDLGLVDTKGVKEGVVYKGNEDIQIYPGKGCDGEFKCHPESGRVWNGIIDYCLSEDDSSGDDSGDSSDDSGDGNGDSSVDDNGKMCGEITKMKQCSKKWGGMCSWDDGKGECVDAVGDVVLLKATENFEEAPDPVARDQPSSGYATTANISTWASLWIMMCYQFSTY
mmetsp:Transcript_3178/g.7036  ORF Transcript_3178/g.7036 Transcript_3178/m.7036 type:complete len:325 (-) Transcript_3178:203-1177(-)